MPLQLGCFIKAGFMAIAFQFSSIRRTLSVALVQGLDALIP